MVSSGVWVWRGSPTPPSGYGGLVQAEWTVPHENRPAPRPLLLVQAFINTRDVEQGIDRLLEASDAQAWLAGAGLWVNDEPPTPTELDTARHLREALRQVLTTNQAGGRVGDKSLDGKSLEALHAFAASARFRIDVQDTNQFLLISVDDGMDGALATLLAIVSHAQRDGSWARLRTCANPECAWVFFDRSHSGQSIWCEMKVCGNRLKNRRYRERATGNSQPQTSLSRGRAAL